MVINYEWMDSHKYENDTQVSLQVPRCKLDGEQVDMREYLYNIFGLGDIYSPGSFNGMVNGEEELHVELYKTKCTFQMDEEGAEGSAAAAVGQLRSLGVESVTCNRPYMLALMHNNEVIFLSALADPTKFKL